MSRFQVIARLCQDQMGAAMAEYGLLAGLIALVVAGGATLLGQDVSTMFNNVGVALAGITTTL